jgi:uridylate kinase
MQNIVISLGGSVILSEKNNVVFLKKLANLLINLSKQFKIFIITGGGDISRRYIKLGRELNLSEDVLDNFGIDITRVNAKLLTNIIKISNNEIPTRTDEAEGIKKPIVVMGGTVPGHSTDMVGAELAEKINASRFIIATNVDGIYDKDPNRYSDAKKIKKIEINQLIKKYGTKWDAAGKNVVVDGPALEIIRRAKLPTFVVNGGRLDQLEKAITGQSFNGTEIEI